jgi:creatinine amidohydrolase/Fe(II)-dependent formamide hydrolase-like protein
MDREKRRYGALSARSQKENGPFDAGNRRVLVFSIGAGNESHGAALSSNIDDYAAIEIATDASLRLGLTYVGHLPYSSDRAGRIAKDWNPGYMPRKALLRMMTADLKRAILVQSRLGNEPSHVVVISGHGGNNFLKEEEASLGRELGTPFHYVPPFQGSLRMKSKKGGRIQITHADDGEHSVGLYLGLLDKRKLRTINELAKKDPEQALRQNPAIMGLGYYVLPHLGGARYEDLRSRHKELVRAALKFVNSDRRIVADYDVGERIMEENVRNAVRQIKRDVLNAESHSAI